MKGREKVITFFLFLILSIIILLQILSMVQSDRFYESLNRLDEIFDSSSTTETFHDKPKTSAAVDKEYPGDEGDWLDWV